MSTNLLGNIRCKKMKQYWRWPSADAEMAFGRNGLWPSADVEEKKILRLRRKNYGAYLMVLGACRLQGRRWVGLHLLGGYLITTLPWVGGHLKPWWVTKKGSPETKRNIKQNDPFFIIKRSSSNTHHGRPSPQRALLLRSKHQGAFNNLTTGVPLNPLKVF